MRLKRISSCRWISGRKRGFIACLLFISPGIMGGCIIAEPRRQSTAFETVIFAENLEDLSLVPSAIPVDGDELQLPSIHQAVIPPPVGADFDRPVFNELVGIETGLFLPNLVTTYFIAPRRLQFDQSITPFYDDKNLPSLGYYSLQTIIPTATFTKPMVTSLTHAIELSVLCHCFDDGDIARFSGGGLIDIDFTAETAQIREINLEDGQQHSLQGTINFRVSNEINSFEDDDAQIWMRLNENIGQQWGGTVKGAFQTSLETLVNGHFTAQKDSGDASMIGRFGTP
ncbi:MAG: hypothetical protein ACO3SH_04250 [Candidatus Puniceispirillaceae bacterium]